MRRRALSVPHSAQRMYIVRANQAVMIALKPSIPTSTTRLSSRSLKLCISPEALFDVSGRAHSPVETPRCPLPPVKR